MIFLRDSVDDGGDENDLRFVVQIPHQQSPIINHPSYAMNSLFFSRCFLTLSLIPVFFISLFAENDDPGEFSIPDVIPIPMEAVHQLRALVKTDPEAAARAEELKEAVRPLLGQPATPLEVIHYEGLLNNDPRRIASVAKLKQMGHAAMLVRHWQATGDPAAADTLRTWIEAWFGAYELTGNDVNENKFLPLLIAYFYLRPEFSSDTRAAIDAFVGELGDVHARAVEASTHFTNRYTKHVRLTTLAGMILERPEWIAASRAGVMRFVEESLHADGSSNDLQRRDTLTYHNSALRPAIQIAMLAPLEEGQALYDWGNSRGGSLRKSVNLVVPYALGQKTREEWKNSTIDLDRRRAEAGIDHYEAGRLYDPQNALRLMELAAYFDPALIKVVHHLTDSSAERFATWQGMVNAAVAATRQAGR
ncbi:MAG: alginate lyase family protein [Opitutales bacterium]